MKTSIIGRFRSAASLAGTTAAVLLLSAAVRAEDPPKPSASKLPIPAKATGAISKLPGIPGFGKSKPAPEIGTATKLPATPATGAAGAAGTKQPPSTTTGPPIKDPPPPRRDPVKPPPPSVVQRVDGKPKDVHTKNYDIHHHLSGNARMVSTRPDGARLVAARGGYGYVQHPYNFRGHEYGARTYYVGGRPVERFYRGYMYRGANLEVYAPAVYYPPAFYGWAYNPWAPVPYAWGWAGMPWFGVYGGFFTPYLTYDSASFWLTDYLIAQSLAAAYDAQLAANIAASTLPPGAPVLTPDVKQAIADEIRQQIALENAEAQTNARNTEFDPASGGIQRMLTDGVSHVFVVGDDLDLVDGNGGECAVSQGDVLRLTQAAPPAASFATLVVIASKGGIECNKGTAARVALSDLQNMQNYMRETLDRGLADLQAHQGGLSTPPQSALALAAPAAFSAVAPPPDQTVAAQINQQWQQGTREEQDTVGQAPPPAAAAPPAAAPPTITPGLTIDQVVTIKGQPTSIVDLGAKKIYVYQDLKIIFDNGKVADAN